MSPRSTKKQSKKKSSKKAPSKKRATKKRSSTSLNKSKRKSNRKSIFKKIFSKWKAILVILLVIFTAYVIYLDFEVREKFGDQRWELGAHVYARPLELYVGSNITAARLERELELLNYRKVSEVGDAGSYYRDNNIFYVKTRRFQFWDGLEISRDLKISFDDDLVSDIENIKTHREVDLVRFDPVLIGGIYPLHHEDRLVVQLKDVPPILIEMLVAVEDRRFYEHIGLDFKAIARALWSIVSGGGLQGGSTITQQFVKSYYLSNERTLWRKFNEAIISLLLEVHYDKDTIIEAYINEIYLGQDGKRSIHGFGLASHFYYNKTLSQLDINELATLVALVRGPSDYHPEKHPQRLKDRRDLVLGILVKQEVITQNKADALKSKPIKIKRNRRGFVYKHPAYMDLVKRQLREYYDEADLRSEGLIVFTTLDPVLQVDSEIAVKTKIKHLDDEQKLKGRLQVAAIVINPTNSEVLALIGDKAPRSAGFNRVLDARRPIGSLIKPIVYLTALAEDGKYTWATLLDDGPLTLESKDGSKWSPSNYDKKHHGKVSMLVAFAKSYNIATVRLGMQVGFSKINKTIHKLGVDKKIPAYPSILLGTTELSPFQVAQMYQPFASAGFSSPIRAITSVLDAQGKPLHRYAIKINQVYSAGLIQVLNTGMVQVAQWGTAKYLKSQYGENFYIGGKTGTTNNKRDSWFVGYTNSHLAVVWVGTDKNEAMGLTGSKGALRVWVDIMKNVSLSSLDISPHDNSEVYWLELSADRLSSSNCGAVVVGFIKGSVPDELRHCK